MIFQLPKLKYSFSDLEPYIDAQTVEIHYTKHHQAYVNNLNKALEGQTALADWTLEDLLTKLEKVPEAIRTTVQNNGGGLLNHNMYWETMKKNAQKEPTGALADAIKTKFGDFSSFKTQFAQAGMTRFGSGWAWLVMANKNLEIVSTPNQNNPITDKKTPILGLDVWEHAYYLKYQNKRNEYIENWWNLVDWEQVEKNFAQL